MNYHMLKILITSLVANFICPECSEGITEQNVEIIGAAGNTINLDVQCDGCQRHTFIKAEVGQIQMSNLWDLGGNFEKLTQKLKQNFPGIASGKIEGIKEKNIMELREVFKGEHTSVNDFLN